MGTQDRIEREVSIDAPLERVWALVTEPGWWIGDGDRSQQRCGREGELAVIEDPRYGRFQVSLEAAEPQHHVSFRWAVVAPFRGQAPAAGNSTLVEFYLSERDGGTVLRVVESGFASLDVGEADRDEAVNGNIKGWEFQLAVLKRLAEGVPA